MKTLLDEIKDEIAKRHRYTDIQTLLKYLIAQESWELINKSIIDETSTIYAEKMAIEFVEWYSVSNYSFKELIDGEFYWTLKTDASKTFTSKEIYEKFNRQTGDNN